MSRGWDLATCCFPCSPTVRLRVARVTCPVASWAPTDSPTAAWVPTARDMSAGGVQPGLSQSLCWLSMPFSRSESEIAAPIWVALRGETTRGGEAPRGACAQPSARAAFATAAAASGAGGLCCAARSPSASLLRRALECGLKCRDLPAPLSFALQRGLALPTSPREIQRHISLAHYPVPADGSGPTSTAQHGVPEGGCALQLYPRLIYMCRSSALLPVLHLTWDHAE
jgi:hypothetical protein